MLTEQQYLRHGPDYRCGEQQTFLAVQQTFGFATVRVGRWVSTEESLLAANLVFDALADLAYVLNVPPTVLGLRQTLNLDFAIGGQPGVQAHYAPGQKILALAKNAGAGALAHEFWHSLDHHLGQVAFIHGNHPLAFASDDWLAERPLKAHPLNQSLARLLALVLLDPSGQQPSDYVRRAVAMDQRQHSCYFAKPTELLARAFESAIEDCASVRNQYLVSGTLSVAARQSGLYPDDAHRQQIFEHICEYFALLGQVAQ